MTLAPPSCSGSCTEIWFVRHGETNSNAKQEVAGQSDANGLTKLGQLQAFETGRYLSRIPFDCAFSSDSVRTRQTTSLLLLGGVGVHPESVLLSALL
ncbi:histidine phosphatase superfamily protein, clade-1, partial [Kipferlia bialata]|eukprot:g5519.t1